MNRRDAIHAEKDKGGENLVQNARFSPIALQSEESTMEDIMKLCGVVRETGFAIHGYHKHGHLARHQATRSHLNATDKPITSHLLGDWAL